MRQEKFKEAKELFKDSGAILLNWATGFGKTLASLKLLGEDDKIIVLCQELGHITNWQRELKKHGLELDIEFHTYASMHKVEGSGYNLILDECHWCLSDLRLENLCAMKYNKIVLLSASMEDDDIDKISVCIDDLIVHTISLQEAIDGGVLPEPEIIVLEIELDNSIKQCLHYKKKGEGGQIFTCTYGNYFKVLKNAKKYKNYYIVCNCTEKQKYDLLASEADFFKKKAYYNDKLWTLYNHKKLEMKRFISERKTPHAEEVMSKLNSRHIVFASSIFQAEQLSDECIHSKNHEKVNEQIIDDFNKYKTNKLVTVQKLRESANLVDIEEGLIVQIDNKLRSPIQMVGRILRGSTPVVYILCVVNTTDDAYVRTHLKNLNHVRKSITTSFP